VAGDIAALPVRHKASTVQAPWRTPPQLTEAIAGDYAQGTSGTPSQVDVPVGNVAVPLYEVRAPPSVQP